MENISEPRFLQDKSFGHWLSGFCAGEGCFRILTYNSPYLRPDCQFVISLRSDDIPILEEIQSYFGCGKIYHCHLRSTRINPNPTSHFRVSGVNQCFNRILPNFDTFPLRAKKQHEYEIWRESVIYHKSISDLPRPPQEFRKPVSRWNSATIHPILDAKKKLEEIRKYKDRTFQFDDSEEGFGDWLAGFTDGEGSFPLSIQRPSGAAVRRRCQYSVGTREDDINCILAIRDFIGCGKIYSGKAFRGSNKTARLSVRGIQNLKTHVLPVFDKHKLRAKKRVDYEIWRKAVLLRDQSNSRSVIPAGMNSGTIPKILPSEREEFDSLVSQMKEARMYDKKPLERFLNQGAFN